ncbi:MAG: hypothetical protein KI790_02655 [Cyclobacteriaceae bacterium]|nr:hypothetical protein [Cyclobacteriaceae bacterium HetDA_MAG_MS6]
MKDRQVHEQPLSDQELESSFEYLLQVTKGNKDKLTALLHIFLNMFEEDLRLLKKNIEEEDIPALRALVHKQLASLKSVGFSQLASEGQYLEEAILKSIKHEEIMRLALAYISNVTSAVGYISKYLKKV